jgi:hypothetical protein
MTPAASFTSTDDAPMMQNVNSQITTIDAGLVGFVFGVAFASAFLTAIFVRFCNSRQRFSDENN